VLLEPGHALLGFADCARWLRDFFADDLAAIADVDHPLRNMGRIDKG
jgi:hypothetical protein